jgi:hypothetical protein
MNPGIRTTEFWLTLAAVVAKTIFPDNVPHEALMTVAAYVASRGVVKFGLSKVGITS